MQIRSKVSKVGETVGIEPWLERVFAPTVTSAIGWTLAVLLMVAVVAGIVGDVQRALAASRAERGESL